MKLSLASLSKFDFFGVLVLRLGAGALVAFHGFPMLLGGADAWTEVGSGAAIARLPESLFLVAGLAACIIQVFGGLLLALGLFTRGAALFLTIVSAFALANVIQSGDFHLTFFAHLQVTLLFFGLLFIGPGRFSLDRKGI
ncbi:DoxX family membrane protein [Pelagicoccus sp. SDUM812003]|uniref:DoxX family membrane protein n=1 Tax=Pelagicoccus sp. SDUM812003 TaxID=3041267 RepID=UPI00280E0BAE|nr:DoxX family membrane protein [Pelagicoccus sp. SDUM812003]MDQ8203124.1 DoxX family membrane protein [Pelagicoccus sp. SDUM812003]